jgi:iron(III) transport system substrate-binding protein
MQKLAIGLAVLAAWMPISAAAADSSPEMGRLSTYPGADRQQVLADGAKKEGALTFYTSIPIPDINAVLEAFTKKYGVRVSVWRAGSEEILQRIIAEARGGRYDADMVDTNGPQMEALYREELLQKVSSPVFATLREGSTMPHGAWTTTRINVFAQAYNTGLLKKELLPKQWADLADTRWKGKLGIEAADSDWFSAVVSQAGGEPQGLDLFRQIVRNNGISVRKGHTLVTNLVVAGEIPLALTTYHFEPETRKKEGAPIDWFSIGKVVVRPNGSGVTRRAPHPHAALLFYDFILGEGQKLLAERNIEVSSKAVKSLISDMPQQVINPADILDNASKWERLYTDIFSNQSR